MYRALNRETGDFRAIKEIPTRNMPVGHLEAVQSEIDLLHNLQHDMIVRYFETIRTESHLYLVLEYVENGSLSTLVKNFGSFPEHLVCVYVRQVLTGLEWLHEQGVCHRDIKGANLLITKDGQVKLVRRRAPARLIVHSILVDLSRSSALFTALSTPPPLRASARHGAAAVLPHLRWTRAGGPLSCATPLACRQADFGVAKKADSRQTSNSVVGTPYWMAPEIIQMSSFTTASDIWSLGCTILELLTGEPPYYDLKPITALYRIVQDEHPPLPADLSPSLHSFLSRCFTRDPERRPTASELRRHEWLVESPETAESMAKRAGAPHALGSAPQRIGQLVVQKVTTIRSGGRSHHVGSDSREGALDGPYDSEGSANGYTGDGLPIGSRGGSRQEHPSNSYSRGGSRDYGGTSRDYSRGGSSSGPSSKQQLDFGHLSGGARSASHSRDAAEHPGAATASRGDSYSHRVLSRQGSRNDVAGAAAGSLGGGGSRVDSSPVSRPADPPRTPPPSRDGLDGRGAHGGSSSNLRRPARNSKGGEPGVGGDGGGRGSHGGRGGPGSPRQVAYGSPPLQPPSLRSPHGGEPGGAAAGGGERASGGGGDGRAGGVGGGGAEAMRRVARALQPGSSLPTDSPSVSLPPPLVPQSTSGSRTDSNSGGLTRAEALRAIEQQSERRVPRDGRRGSQAGNGSGNSWSEGDDSVTSRNATMTRGDHPRALSDGRRGESPPSGDGSGNEPGSSAHGVEVAPAPATAGGGARPGQMHEAYLWMMGEEERAVAAQAPAPLGLDSSQGLSYGGGSGSGYSGIGSLPPAEQKRCTCACEPALSSASTYPEATWLAPHAGAFRAGGDPSVHSASEQMPLVGFLWKRGSSWRSFAYQRRFFYLVDDVLCYRTKPLGQPAELGVPPPMDKGEKRIPLSSVTSVRMHSKLKYEFELVCVSRSYRLRAPSAQSLALWVTAISSEWMALQHHSTNMVTHPAMPQQPGTAVAARTAYTSLPSSVARPSAAQGAATAGLAPAAAASPAASIDHSIM